MALLLLACMFVGPVLQATSFRAKAKTLIDHRQNRSRSAELRVIAKFRGWIKSPRLSLTSNESFNIIGSKDTSVTYNVKVDDPVKSFKVKGGRLIKLREQRWISYIKPASLTLRGVAGIGVAGIDLTRVKSDKVLVSVQLGGRVRGIITGNTCIFEREDGGFERPGFDLMLVPLHDIVVSSPGRIPMEGSVTEVSRAGKTIFVGNAFLFYPVSFFGTEVIHKEYVLRRVSKKDSTNVVVEVPLFVKGGGLCGTELFSTPALTCSLIKSLDVDVAMVTSLTPTNNRGFGLEFELVSRSVPTEIAEAAKEDFKMNPLPNCVEQYNDDHAGNYRNKKEYNNIVTEVQYVNYCFRESINSFPGSGDARCAAHTECKLNEFCTKSQECGNRSECMSDHSIDDVCPVSLDQWNWESDVTVELLDEDTINAIPGADKTEMQGVGMEIVSPGPPNVLSGKLGIQSAAELVGILVRQGVQAGPSQGFHVHVNVLSPDAPGDKLSLKGIASVWVAWAKYQLAIDEMLSPGRPDNQWSYRLFLAPGEPWQESAPHDCRKTPATCAAMFFMNMHKYIVSHEDEVLEGPEDSRDFCNAIFELPGDEMPCDDRYPHQRYFQINLMPLIRYGTIEFRPHSATVKVERVARWVQFVTAFVEHFGNSEAGLAETSAFFDDSFEIDFSELREAQRSASLSQLFLTLKGKVDSGSMEYYDQRKWEDGDAICDAEKEMLLGQSLGGMPDLELKSRRRWLCPMACRICKWGRSVIRNCRRWICPVGC